MAKILFIWIFISSGIMAKSTDNVTVPIAASLSPEPVACQPNPVLNALMYQLLLTYMQPQFLQQTPSHQLLPQTPELQPLAAAVPPMANFNQLFRPQVNELNNVPKFRTTVVTSSVVSTSTRLLSTIVSIWFRNERIPTTIFSNTVLYVTETVTSTSTIALEPTLFRKKRNEPEPSVELDSSLSANFLSDDVISNDYVTSPLESFDDSALFDSESQLTDSVSAVVKQPQVQEAWNRFLLALEQAMKDQIHSLS